MTLSDALWGEARALVATRLGLDLADHRRADLEAALVRIAREGPEGGLAWLAPLPDAHPAWRQLASCLTVGETYFFRDRGVMDALEQHVLPSLIAARRADGSLRLRLWSAGCATGEEAYSLAILVDRLLPDRSDWSVTILATDLDRRALEVAQRGRYREWSFRDTPRWVRDRWFHDRGPERIEIDARIRRMVTFAPLNLADDGYPSAVTNTTGMDVILCRNVVMYFTGEARRRTVARMRRALAIGGWLVVSAVEASVDLYRPLTPVSFPGTVFYRNDLASSMAQASRAPADALLEAAAAFAPPSTDLALVRAPLTPVHDTRGDDSAGPATPLERARWLANRGDLDEARRSCEAVLVRDRLDPDAHVLLAAICQEQGDIAAAIGALRRAIYLSPDLATPYFLLGSVLLRQGERRGGRRAMETALGLLSSVAADEPLPGGDGVTAGRLRESARTYLEVYG